jgi:hypothetical protein
MLPIFFKHLFKPDTKDSAAELPDFPISFFCFFFSKSQSLTDAQTHIHHIIILASMKHQRTRKKEIMKNIEIRTTFREC